MEDLGHRWSDGERAEISFVFVTATALDQLRVLCGQQVDRVVAAVGPDSAVLAMSCARAGVSAYLTEALDDLESTVTGLLQPQPGAPRAMRKADVIVGDSPVMEQVRNRLNIAARADVPVLITGESGTGKELAARALHFGGKRRTGQFVAVNCGALTDALAESLLFGVKKGAFTGADRDRVGLFQEADGGTLLLDEIGTAPPALQVKLLRVLERGELNPVGSPKVVTVDVRVVAATNADMQEAVRAKVFRADLYYRLSGFEIVLPPLRSHPDDIAPLLNHHLALQCARQGRPMVRFSPGAVRRLSEYPWPGNVRELVHFVSVALLLAEDEAEIDEQKIEGIFRERPKGAPSSGGVIPSFREAREAFERSYVETVLRATNGNVSKAAAMAKKERKDFYDLCHRAGVLPRKVPG